MSSDSHVLLDPYVVAIPEPERSVDEYLQQLMDWLPLLNRQRERCSIQRAAVAALMEENRYPTHSTLAARLRAAGAEAFSVPDVQNWLRPIAEREPYFEDYVGIQAVLVESAHIEPDTVLTRLGESTRAAFRDGLFLAALVDTRSRQGQGVVVGSPALPAAGLGVAGRISAIETTDGVVEELDLHVAREIEVVSDACFLDVAEDLATLYARPIEAVALICRSIGVDVKELPTVTAGPLFVDSLTRLGVHRADGVLRQVYRRAAQALVGELPKIAGARLHPVRESSAADADQVVRSDGGRLWRCMVTKHGAGYRLHYWQKGDGSIELEALMKESDV
jgi:hypothetical protein